MGPKLKTGLLLLLLWVSIPGFSAPKDFIVLLDTSQSMFDYYDDVVQVFMSDVLKQHLRLKDDFHLVSFSETPELEIRKKIERSSDVEPILKRLLLLQPLGKTTDLVGALDFLKVYAGDLGESRPKTLIILSDGVNNPPPNKAISPEEAQKLVTARIKEFRGYGWTVSFIRVPPLASSPAGESPKGPRQSGSDQILDLESLGQETGVKVQDFSQSEDLATQAVGSPKVGLPENLGKVGRRFSFPVSFQNAASETKNLRIREVLFQGQNVLTERTTVSVGPGETKSVDLPLEFPDNQKDGEGSGSFSLVFDDNNRAYPSTGQVAWSLESSGSWVESLIPWVLGILGFAGAGVLVFFGIRRLWETGQSLADKAESRPGHMRASSGASPSLAGKANPSLPGTTAKVGKTVKPEAPGASVVTGIKNREAAPISGTVQEVKKKEAPLSTPLPSASSGKIQAKEILPPRKPSDEKDRTENARLIVPSPKLPFPKAAETRGLTKASILPVNHGAPAPFHERVKKDLAEKAFFLDVWTPNQIHQNTSGGSNILTMRPGDLKLIGPGSSGFRIFLKPLKKAVAEVLFDGTVLSLKPLGNHFPDIKHDELFDCTDKVIKLELEPDGEFLFLHFSQFISKEELFNRAVANLPKAKRTPF